jgi:hypothetical protein
MKESIFTGKTRLEDIYKIQRESSISDNIIDLTIKYEDFVDKANQQK